MTALVRVLIVLIAAVWIISEFRQGLQRRPEAESADRGSLFVVRIAYVIGIVGALAAKKVFPSLAFSSDDFLWLELPMLFCGVFIRIWSFRTLGRYFTFTVQTSDDQPVISTGPYKLVRHPGYLGLLMAVAAVSFSLENWASVVILVGAMACGLMYRITVEEKALIRDLGGRYESFAKDRKRLIPFVW